MKSVAPPLWLCLLDLMDEMINSLHEAGKISTAEYFISVKKKILTTNNNAKMKVVLKRLMSSGAMSQYANFSFKQDQIFDKISDLAENMYKNIHSCKLAEKIYDLIE